MSFNIEDLEKTEYGYRLRVTDEYCIETWKMIFNWRLVVMREVDSLSVEHGYCYFGTGPDALIRSVAAGLSWEDPLNSPPEGFDKQAF